MGKFPMSSCPKCDNDEFYVKQNVSGTIDYNYKLDGSRDAYNGDYIDHLRYKTISKYAYCNNCNKRLFKITDELNL